MNNYFVNIFSITNERVREMNEVEGDLINQKLIDCFIYLFNYFL